MNMRDKFKEAGFTIINDNKNGTDSLSTSSSQTSRSRVSNVVTQAFRQNRNNKINNTYNNMILFLLYFMILLVVGLMYDRIANNTTGVSRQTFTYAFIGIVVPICIMIFVFAINNESINISNPLNNISLFVRIALMSIFVLFFIGIIYFFNTNTILFNIVTILIVIVGLAIIFNQIHNFLERSIQNTTLKLIIELIFFLPCLLNDILKWFLNQIKMTPYFTYVLLFIELILILSYFYLPILLKKIVITNNGIVLQDAPFYINKGKRIVIATSSDLLKTDTNDKNNLIYINNNNPFNKDYALSMWININPHVNSKDKEIEILSYGTTSIDDTGNPKSTYKPAIFYKSTSTINDKTAPSNKDVYKIHLGSSNDFFEIHVPNQRWNHFLFNYIDGKMAELWINGILERVFEFGQGIPPPIYDASDQISIGNTTPTGTNGAICKVVYFNNSISPEQIRNIYNLTINDFTFNS